MIRLALPKGRNLEAALAAFRAAGIGLRARRLGGPQPAHPAPGGRRSRCSPSRIGTCRSTSSTAIADCGIVGSDVLERGGRRPAGAGAPARGALAAVAHRPRGRTLPARRAARCASRPSTRTRPAGSSPAGPGGRRSSSSRARSSWRRSCALAELALDIVQTGRTLAENDLVEIETVAEVAACLVVNRASYQRHRRPAQRLDRPPRSGGGGAVSALADLKADSRAGRRAVERLDRPRRRPCSTPRPCAGAERIVTRCAQGGRPRPARLRPQAGRRRSRRRGRRLALATAAGRGPPRAPRRLRRGAGARHRRGRALPRAAGPHRLPPGGGRGRAGGAGDAARAGSASMCRAAGRATPRRW